MANRIFVASSPHIHSVESTTRIMRDVIIALIPAFIVSAMVFGWSVVILAGVSIASCMLFEWVITRFLLKKQSTIGDLSAVVTGLLLAFNLPASLDWWIVVIGAFVAIVVAKMSFGGLGRNPFNPALVGRVFLLIAYPVQMTSFPRANGIPIDSFSGATPLEAVKDASMPLHTINYQDMLFGSIPGSLGEVATLALLVGFAYLLWRRVITWHIPVIIFATMALFAFLAALGRGYSPQELYLFPLFHVMSGGAVLGAIYMATDYSSSPMTRAAMVIYAIGIGAITMCIRLWGAYPEGMSFAILIMNAIVPLLNKYVKPKRYGVK